MDKKVELEDNRQRDGMMFGQVGRNGQNGEWIDDYIPLPGPMFSFSNCVSLLPPSQGQLVKTTGPRQET